MYSEWYPWDFKNCFNADEIDSAKGISAFWIYDSFIEKLVLNKIKARTTKKWEFSLSKEVDDNFIDNVFISNDLFCQKRNIIVFQSEDIQENLQKKIIEKQNVFNGYLILLFSKKSKFFDELSKNESVNTYKVLEHRFWEAWKLLDYLLDEYVLHLTNDIKKFIIDSYPANCSDFIQAIEIIKNNFNVNTNTTLSEIKTFLIPNKFDKFNLADIWSRKKKSVFFKEILIQNLTFDNAREIASFMQSHLLKVFDNSYTLKKKRLSKYDKGILQASKIWTVKELEIDIKMFARLELEIKKRPSSHNKLIKKKYIDYLKLSDLSR